MKLFIIFVLTAGVSLIPTSAMESMQLKSTISSKLRKQDKWGSIGKFFGGHKDSAKPKPESQDSSHMTCCEQVIGAIKEVLGSSTAVSAAGRTLSSRWWHSHCPMWYRWLGWSCTDTKERAIRTLNSYCATHDPEKSIHGFDELPKEIASWLENVKNPAIESSSNGSGGSATAEKSFGGAVSSLLGSAAKVIASISEKSGTTSPSCAATTCSGYPAFIQAPTGKANQTRAAQATLATAVATVVRDTLRGEAGGGPSWSLQNIERTRSEYSLRLCRPEQVLCTGIPSIKRISEGKRAAIAMGGALEIQRGGFGRSPLEAKEQWCYLRDFQEVCPEFGFGHKLLIRNIFKK